MMYLNMYLIKKKKRLIQKDETRNKLADCLNKPNNQEILKDDLYKMLHIVKTDQDIDLIVKIIKM